MLLTFLAIVVLVGGVWLLPKALKNAEAPNAAVIAARVVSVFVAFIMIAATSFIYVGSDEVGHLKRVYGGGELPQGQIIARDGENGYQAETLKPGFHFIPFLNVIYDTETLPAVEIPAGFYGLVQTRDGVPLNEDEIMAQPWEDDNFANMLDAKHFLENGGQKGVQYSVLKPGTYFLNLYLYQVTVGDDRPFSTVYGEDGVRDVTVEEDARLGAMDTRLTTIPPGHVGVVTSRVEDKEMVCREEKIEVDMGEAAQTQRRGTLEVPLVPNGCRGIWREALRPGGYYLNLEAMKVTVIDTRVQAWNYSGGYDSRLINLTVAEDGRMTQESSTKNVPVPSDAADTAVDVKVEGWPVWQNLRALVQVTPENAPIVVAAVGDMDAVEDRVVTPAIWSEVRDVLGGQAPMPTGEVDEDGKPIMKVRQVRILDVIEFREALQEEVSRRMLEQGLKAGVAVMEIRFGNPDVPPEMLVARKREQLATQLEQAYVEEQRAQTARQTTEEARALAEEQARLVAADIDVEVSERRQTERENLGAAERNYLTQVAQGEKARAQVLGEDRVLMLNMFERFMKTLETKPELVGLVGKLVPQTVVTGGNGAGLEGAAAIFGQAFKGTQDTDRPTTEASK